MFSPTGWAPFHRPFRAPCTRLSWRLFWGRVSVVVKIRALVFSIPPRFFRGWRGGTPFGSVLAPQRICAQPWPVPAVATPYFAHASVCAVVCAAATTGWALLPAHRISHGHRVPGCACEPRLDDVHKTSLGRLVKKELSSREATCESPDPQNVSQLATVLNRSPRLHTVLVASRDRTW